MGIFILQYIFGGWGSLTLIALVIGSPGQSSDASPWLRSWWPEQARLTCLSPTACQPAGLQGKEAHGRSSHYALPAHDNFFPVSIMSFHVGVPKTTSAPVCSSCTYVAESASSCLLLKLCRTSEVAGWSWKGESSLRQRCKAVLAAVSPPQVGGVSGFLRSSAFSDSISAFRSFSSTHSVMSCINILFGTTFGSKDYWHRSFWKLPPQPQEWERFKSRWKILHSTFYWDDPVFWGDSQCILGRWLNFI